MYNIPFKDFKDAAGILYRFMTDSDLTRPECSIFTKDKSTTITNNGDGFITEAEFFRKLNVPLLEAVLCVASTDKADTRRVVLSLIPQIKMMVLNFPSADGKLNAAEKRLMERLE